MIGTSVFAVRIIQFEIVLEYFQVCEWNTALWEKRQR